MRLMVVVGVIGVMLALSISAARYIGHATAADPFPVPDQDGCWAGVCFDAIPYSVVADTLNAHARIAPGSAHWTSDTQATGYNFLLAFDVRCERYGAQPVLLSLADGRYSLAQDWRTPGSPALLRMGDVIAMVGPPRSVVFAAGAAYLGYPERGLRVVVKNGTGYLAPEDDVYALVVQRTPSTTDARYQDYAWHVATWHGFGRYRTGE